MLLDFPSQFWVILSERHLFEFDGVGLAFYRDFYQHETAGKRPDL